MEQSCLTDKVFLNFLLTKHHICPRISIERKFSVSIRESMYKCKRRVHFIISQKIRCINPCTADRIPQQSSKLIISYFSQKCSLLPSLFSIASTLHGAPPGQASNRLFPCSLCPFIVNQSKVLPLRLRQIFFHLVSPSLFLIKVNQLFDWFGFFNMLCLQNRSGTFIH